MSFKKGDRVMTEAFGIPVTGTVIDPLPDNPERTDVLFDAASSKSIQFLTASLHLMHPKKSD